MAFQLTPEQVSQLRSAYFTPAEIQKFQSGQGDNTLNQRINKVLTNKGSFLGGPTSVQTNPIKSFNTQPGLFQGATPPSWAYDNPANQKPKSNLANPGATPAPTGPGGRTYSTGGVTGSIDPNTGQARKPSAPVAVWQPSGGVSAAQQGATPPVPSELPGMPDLGNYVTPTLTIHDFMPQARALVDQAWAPVFASLDQSKTNIGTQGENSRKIVGGLYENMVKDVATQAANNAAQIDASKQTATDQGAALNQQIGANYQGAQSNTADLLSKLGIQAAAPELLQDQANQQGWQQGQAATNTNAQQNYYDAQKQGQAAHDTSLGQITQNQGAVAQQDILGQVQSALAGVDQQIAGQKSQSAQQALQMGQDLSNQDFQMQQANAGYQMQGQDAARQAALQAWQAQIDALKYKDQSAQQTWENQRTVTNDQNDLDLKTGQLALDQQAAATKAAGSGAGGSLTPDQTNGVVKAKYAIQAALGEQVGADLFNVAMQLAAQIPDKSDPAAYTKYMQGADAYAQSHNLPPDQVRLAAAQVYGAL